MFENIMGFFKRFGKNDKENSKNTAKERLHLVLAQDRANISADFLEMMKQEIIEVIKKYIDIDEKAIDVRMTNKPGEDGTIGAPSLYANIPIVTIKNEARKLEGSANNEKQEASKEPSEANETEKAQINSEELSDHKEERKEKIQEETKQVEETISENEIVKIENLEEKQEKEEQVEEPKEKQQEQKNENISNTSNTKQSKSKKSKKQKCKRG